MAIPSAGIAGLHRREPSQSNQSALVITSRPEPCVTLDAEFLTAASGGKTAFGT